MGLLIDKTVEEIRDGDRDMDIVTVSGYGFTPNYTEEGFTNFIKNHEETIKTFEDSDEILNALQNGDNALSDIMILNFRDERSDYGGVNAIISNVMAKETGIGFQLEIGDIEPFSFDDERIMFVYKAPWFYNDKEKTITKEQLDNIITPYLNELENDKNIEYIELKSWVNVDYQE